MLKKVRKAIEQNQNQLIKKVKKNGLWENFGQNEVTKIKDQFKYDDLIHGDPKEREAAQLIDQFETWCEDFSLEDLN